MKLIIWVRLDERAVGSRLPESWFDESLKPHWSGPLRERGERVVMNRVSTGELDQRLSADGGAGARGD